MGKLESVRERLVQTRRFVLATGRLCLLIVEPIKPFLML
jgi:hypothetical protein